MDILKVGPSLYVMRLRKKILWHLSPTFRALQRNATLVNTRFDLLENKLKWYGDHTISTLTATPDEFQVDCRQGAEFHWIPKFYKEMMSLPLPLKDSYFNLLNGLDDSSQLTVNRILKRVNNFIEAMKNKQGSLDCFSIEEKDAIADMRRTLYDNILQLNTECYAYKKYFLPVRHFEASVFYCKHEMGRITDKNLITIKNRDIIDAGGYIGDSAIVLSDYTNRTLYSFEPVSANFARMQKTVELNKAVNIIPVQLGLSDKNEEQECYLRGAGSGLHFILTSARETIKMTTLDEFVVRHNLEVGLIKVDLEGHEQFFLTGAKETIKRFRPTLLLSIYHCAKDFFYIKPLLESWELDYKFKIIKPTDGQILLETILIAEPN